MMFIMCDNELEVSCIRGHLSRVIMSWKLVVLEDETSNITKGLTLN